MNNPTLVIVGAGPRGLAVALQASILNKHNIILIDNNPINSWTFPNIMSDIQMRSPISFDLTAHCPELKKYSLSKYLHKYQKFDTLPEIEECKEFCSRQEFKSYLNHILLNCIDNKVKLVKDKVINITKDNITLTSNHVIPYNYLVIATGINNHVNKTPTYLLKSSLNFSNILSIKDIHQRDISHTAINVIGSGQYAAEILEFIINKNAIATWITNHKINVSQYPIPSSKEWGYRSAFSSYYKTLQSSSFQISYLKKVKEWGPSITSNIDNKLKEVKEKYKIISNIHSINDLEEIKNNYYIIACGSQPDLSTLPFNFYIDRSLIDPKLPYLTKGFKLNNYNIYFTGTLATGYDGPRQGSLISSGITAKEIIDQIINN